MYVRLAFAVAAHLEPEILLVDEVLSVGDAEFQRRCLGRMEELGNAGRTVVFVSHALPADRAALRPRDLDRRRPHRRRRQAGRGDRQLPAPDAQLRAPSGCGPRSRRRATTSRRSARSARCRTRGCRRASSTCAARSAIEIGFEVLREGKPLFPKIKVLDEEGAVAFNAMDTDERWLRADAAGRVRLDGVDPGQPAERGLGDRRGGDLQPRLPEARAPRGGLRGGLVRGARPRRGRLRPRPVQRSVARRRPAAARLDRRADSQPEVSAAPARSRPLSRRPRPAATTVSVSSPRTSGPTLSTPCYGGSRDNPIPRSTWWSRMTGRGPKRRRPLRAGDPCFGDRLVHAWQPGRRIPSRTRAESRRGDRLAEGTSSSSTATAFRVVTSSPRSAEGSIPGWFLAGTRLQLGERLRSRSCADRRPIEELEPRRAARSRAAVTSSAGGSLTPRDRRRAWRPNFRTSGRTGTRTGSAQASREPTSRP